MTADPWIVLTGHLQALAIGGLPARRETIKDATINALTMFAPLTHREATRHELMIMAVADIVAWDKWTDEHLRLLMAAVALERVWRAELKKIETMIPVATSARWMKGATG